MQIKEDGWRGFMVQKVAMNPEHPMSKFSIGTLDTLDGDAYSALITFFEGHYSANQMGAVILHNEPIATLKPWVTELLGQVPNRDLPNLDLTTPLTAPGQLPATLRHQTLKSDRSVSFSFPIPAIDPYYQTKPTGYIGSLIGHEGQGSLHQLLTQKGWITGLGAGSENIDQANAIFKISVQLTEAGMDASTRHHRSCVSTTLIYYAPRKPKHGYIERPQPLRPWGFGFGNRSRPLPQSKVSPPTS